MLTNVSVNKNVNDKTLKLIIRKIVGVIYLMLSVLFLFILETKKPAGSAEEIEKHFGCDSSKLIMVISIF